MATEPTSGKTTSRIDELDYLKCIMIVLMISFHLVYIEELHPYAKQVVYTFHMPVFMLISGYLMNIAKATKMFLRTMLWIAVPYIIMESGYTLMASVLPIREHIDNLTLGVFLNKLIIDPLGPYWYLHSLILCGITYYAIFHLSKMQNLANYILLAIIYFLFAKIGIMSLPLSMYFLAGVIIRHSSFDFLQIFRPSFLALPAIILLIINPENLHSGSIGGALIVYLTVSLCLAIYPFLNNRLRDGMLFIGRNTLQILLFSPIFTIICKQLIPFLSFDPTGLLFIIVALLICISGSLAISWIIDVCKLSRFFIGRDKMIS